MEILLNKLRELSQYQQVLKQLQIDGKQLPGLGLPRAARLPAMTEFETVMEQSWFAAIPPPVAMERLPVI